MYRNTIDRIHEQVVIGFVLAVIVCPIVLICGTFSNRGEWIKAEGNIWTGVKLYQTVGRDKVYVGEVLGGNAEYDPPWSRYPFDGVKIRTRAGETEWREREELETGTYYVRKDDPALKRLDWVHYED